jgi:hypothetical protein
MGIYIRKRMSLGQIVPGVGMTDAAFNNMVHEWLNQIEQLIKRMKDTVISESEREVLLKKHKTIFDIFIGFKNSSDPEERRKPMEIFLQSVLQEPAEGCESIEHLISQRKEELWSPKYATALPLINTLHLDKYWPTFSPKTKNGMWEFLNGLLMLGKTISMIPKEALPQIEQFAAKIMSNPEWSEGIVNNDPNTQQAMLQSMFSSLVRT